MKKRRKQWKRPVILEEEYPISEEKANPYGMTAEQRAHIRESVNRIWDEMEHPRRHIFDKENSQQKQ